MSGVVLMICVPTKSKEHELSELENVTSTKKFDTFDDENSLNITLKRTNSQSSIQVPQNLSMIELLENTLELFNITNAVWYRGEGEYVQAVFPLESQEDCESILYIMNSNNVGKLYNSAVSVLPCVVHYRGHKSAEQCETETCTSESGENPWSKIISSKNTRLTVDQIVEIIKNKARLTFDFICLILISTTMCALGLVENSTVYLLSSMVMSPMMGPVMAATFGTVIKDRHLKKMGVQNELLGLGLATLVGFCYGTVICTMFDEYGSQEWPTYEITSRGELRSLWIGCIIALLSGAAVALGILSDNIASLVGVAISTSLMPPAVNAGLLWSMATVYYIKGNSTTRYSSLHYEHHYSNSDGLELLALGAVSISLTLVNIFCIYFAAICIFKLKEVAPIATRDKERRQFWKYDIKNARHNNTIQKEEGQNVRGKFKNVRQNTISLSGDIFHWSMDISRDATRCQSTWTASTRPNYCKKTPKSGRNTCMSREHFEKNVKRMKNIGKQTRLSEGEQSFSSEQSNAEKNSKLIFTKSKTFVVTPCRDIPKNHVPPQM